MNLTKELARKVINGLEYGSYEQYADDPAEGDDDLQEWVDEIADLHEKYGYSLVTALAEFIEDAQSDHVTSHEVEEYVERHFKGSGRSKGEVLAAHAEGDDFDLGQLWGLLYRSGGMDAFDWNAFADSSSHWLADLIFIEVPTTGGENTVYLFQTG